MFLAHHALQLWPAARLQGFWQQLHAAPHNAGTARPSRGGQAGRMRGITAVLGALPLRRALPFPEPEPGPGGCCRVALRAVMRDHAITLRGGRG